MSLSCNLAVALTNSCSLLFLIGSARIVFASFAYKIMMHLFPPTEVEGKRPVRSVATLPEMSVDVRKAQFVRVGGAVISTGLFSWGSLTVVL